MCIHKNDAAVTAQKMKFSIKNFLSKCYQIHSFLLIWSHLLKKPLMENFIFCAVNIVRGQEIQSLYEQKNTNHNYQY